MDVPWSNEAAIRRWNSVPLADLEAMEPDGDFAKRHLVNPVLVRLLGDVSGRRVLDAGCGTGYFGRMLAARGATVVGVEPTDAMYAYAVSRGGGVDYVQADLAALPDLGAPFDAVVCSMVLSAVPAWRSAMRACVAALRPGGLFVFTINHPAFEELWTTWRAHGEYRVSEYLSEYQIMGRHAPDFHRPLSVYLNELATMGCRLRELVEPGLDEAVARSSAVPGIEAYVHLPNFLIAAAEAPSG
jgi:SAM-dependent methyltransferase